MRRGLVGIALAAVFAVGAVPAAAQSIDVAPLDEEPPQAELDAYRAALPCPELPGYELREDTANASAFTSGETTTYPNRSRRCLYVPEGSNTRALDLTLAWAHPDTPDATACGQQGNRTDDGTSDVSAYIPATSAAAAASYRVSRDAAGTESAIRAAADGWLATVSSFARPCAEAAIRLTCPSIAGLTGPEAEQSEFYSEEFEARCDYEDPENGTIALTLIAHWVPESGASTEVTQACSEETTALTTGFGVVASDGRAAYTTYWVHSPAAGVPSEDDATAGAQAMTSAAEAQGRTCAGVEAFPTSQLATPIPGFLGAAFTPEHVAAELPTITATTDAPETTAPPETSGVTETTTPSPEPGSKAAASGAPDDTRRLVVYALTGLSVLLLGWSLLRARRESRVRPGRDILRVLFIAGAAIGSLVVLDVETPALAIAGGAGAGAVLGLAQGLGLKVRATRRGVYARRTVLAVVAFAAGLAVTQVAAVLNRTNTVPIGIGISALSATMATGIIVGRAPRVRRAKAGVAGVAAALLAGAALAGAVTPSSEAQEPITDCFYFSVTPDARCAAHEQLIDKVDWTSVGFFGGLYAHAGKPLLELSVPRGLDTPPDPVSRVVEWTDDVVPGRLESTPVASYTADETFTFGPRPDGLCCTVEYTGTATRTVTGSDGTPAETVTEAAGRLFDIQAVGSAIVSELGSRPAIPFGEQTSLQGQPDGSCVRGVAEILPVSKREGGQWTFYVVDGEDRTTSPPGGSAAFGSALVIPCDVPGFTAEDALAAAPPPPPPGDPARIRGRDAGSCPVYQEVMATLTPAGGFTGVDTRSIGDLYLEPNDRACSRGALFTPLVIGEGGPGNTRHELVYEIGYADEAADAERLADAFDTFHDTTRPYEVTDQCETTGNGSPVAPREDGGRCQVISWHRTEGDGTVFLWTDYQYFDGPNVFIRAIYPWGEYRYRCHHCEPTDPHIPDFLAALHDFMRGARVDLSGYVGDRFEELPDETPVTTTPGSESGEADDLVDLFTDEDTTPEEAALIAAAIGLIGAAGVAGLTALDGRREEDLDPADDDTVRVWDEDTGTAIWMSREEADEFYERQREREVGRHDAETAENLKDLPARTEREAAEEAARLEAEASHRQRIWDWFEAHPDYGHLWERVIKPDGSIDRELLNRVVTHAREADEDLPEIGFWEDFLHATGKEIFTGREADGSLSASAVTLRTLLGLLSGGSSEFVFTPGDALFRMQEMVDKGDMRDWNEIASDAIGQAVLEELFGEVLGRGLEMGVAGLKQAFPGLSQDAAEYLSDLYARLDRPVGPAAPRAISQELTSFKGRISDALEQQRLAAEMAERFPESPAARQAVQEADNAMRELFAGKGMGRMNDLQTAGHLSNAERQALVAFHDGTTGAAIDTGARNAIGDWQGTEGLPNIEEVYVGNSGSVGPNRSVKTDADRTFHVTFNEAQLEDYAKANNMSMLDAQQELQARFTNEFHTPRAADALNPEGAVPLDAVTDMDMANYSGIGSGAGPDDAYPLQYTRARQSIQGTTEVYSVRTDGTIGYRQTSGDALLDQMRLTEYDLTGRPPITAEDVALRTGISEADAQAMIDAGFDPDQVWIPQREMTLLHNEQAKIYDHYTDIKSVAKAVDRDVKVASMTGQPLPDPTLEEMARAIRARPGDTNQILHDYGYTEEEAVTALKDMMSAWNPDLS